MAGIREPSVDAQLINISVNSLSRQCNSDPDRNVVHEKFQHIQRLSNLSVIIYPQPFQYT